MALVSKDIRSSRDTKMKKVENHKKLHHINWLFLNETEEKDCRRNLQKHYVFIYYTRSARNISLVLKTMGYLKHHTYYSCVNQANFNGNMVIIKYVLHNKNQHLKKTASA